MDVLSQEARVFLSELHRKFNETRKDLLRQRAQRQMELDSGKKFNFLEETRGIREDREWRVAPTPKDLEQRWVEITGPVEKKMMINALNSGADVFMADFEDSLSPTWKNITEGQANLKAAVDRTLEFTSPEGKEYKLNDKIAILVVRPRGWHLDEKHFQVGGENISGSLFDFGLYFFHNAKALLAKGTAPYFYLPKMESHHEARLWNQVFLFAQERLKMPIGSIRATVLIETFPAAFEMEEILYELRQHSAGLNAGRWDYMFSILKKFQNDLAFVFPDRGQITMTVPFMRAYTELLVRTCHKRGAHAMGGMAAFIPSRKDVEINARALGKVREDKLRESKDGFDGTWVAHPDLVSTAREIFQKALNERPHQKELLKEDVAVTAEQLRDFKIPEGKITEAGMRQNVRVALQYISSWLQGIGAVAIDNLMEDAATAEISRAQLWNWLHHKGGYLTPENYRKYADEEQSKLDGTALNTLQAARRLLDRLVLDGAFAEFLTLIAYDQLD